MGTFTKYKCRKCKQKVETSTSQLIELKLCDDCSGLSSSLSDAAKVYTAASELVDEIKDKSDDKKIKSTASELNAVLQKYNLMLEQQDKGMMRMNDEIRALKDTINRKTYRDYDFLLPNIEAVTEQVNKVTRLIEMRSKENGELLKLNFGEIQNKSMRKHIDDLSSCLNRDGSVFGFVIAALNALLIEIIKINKAIREKQKDTD